VSNFGAKISNLRDVISCRSTQRPFYFVL